MYAATAVPFCWRYACWAGTLPARYCASTVGLPLREGWGGAGVGPTDWARGVPPPARNCPNTVGLATRYAWSPVGLPPTYWARAVGLAATNWARASELAVK